MGMLQTSIDGKKILRIDLLFQTTIAMELPLLPPRLVAVPEPEGPWCKNPSKSKYICTWPDCEPVTFRISSNEPTWPRPAHAAAS